MRHYVSVVLSYLVYSTWYTAIRNQYKQQCVQGPLCPDQSHLLPLLWLTDLPVEHIYGELHYDQDVLSGRQKLIVRPGRVAPRGNCCAMCEVL